MNYKNIRAVTISVTILFLIIGYNMEIFDLKEKNQIQSTKLETIFLQNFVNSSHTISQELDKIDLSQIKRYIPSLVSIQHESKIALDSITYLDLDSVRINKLTKYFSTLYETTEKILDSFAKDFNYENEVYTLNHLSPYARKIENEIVPPLKFLILGIRSSNLGTENLNEQSENQVISNYSDLESFYEKIDSVFDNFSAQMIIPTSSFDITVTKDKYHLFQSQYKVNEEYAKKIALEVLGQNANLTPVFKPTFPNMYMFLCDNASVEISAQGGYVVRMTYLPKKITSKSISVIEATNSITSFLNQIKITDMEITDFFKDGDTYYASLSRVIKSNSIGASVIAHSESIKMSVCASSGKITLFDALEYYKHFDPKRVLYTNVLSEAEAFNIFNKDGVMRLAIIVNANQSEEVCYELMDNNGNLSYINAYSGESTSLYK